MQGEKAEKENVNSGEIKTPDSHPKDFVKQKGNQG